MGKILLFAHDPGGANAISPLIEALKNNGHELFVYAKGPAISKIPQAVELKSENIQNFLKELAPDFILTGTSANDFTEKYLWRAAKNMNIKSMAFLDHWINYGIRFSKYGLKDIQKYNKNKSFDFLPDYICVMDDFAKQEMIKEGIPEKIIYSFGNPHFESLKKQIKLEDIEKIRSKFIKKGEDFIITFASEPYTEDYGLGNEKQVLRDLQDIITKIDKKISLVVKLHPKEELSKYSEFEYLYIEKETNSIDMIMASDLIISMTSMVLIEAMILDKNILSYQPNETNINKFILTRNKFLDFINKKEDLESKIKLQILNNQNRKNSFELKKDSIYNIVKFLENNLCRN